MCPHGMEPNFVCQHCSQYQFSKCRIPTDSFGQFPKWERRRQVREAWRTSLDAFLKFWTESEQKTEIITQLEEQGVFIYIN